MQFRISEGPFSKVEISTEICRNFFGGTNLQEVYISGGLFVFDNPIELVFDG